MLIKSKAVLRNANLTAESLPETSAHVNPAGTSPNFGFGDSAITSVATATAIDAAVIQSTPPPPPPPAFSHLTKFGKKGLVGGLLLVSCGLVFSPEVVLAQTSDYPNCAEGTRSYHAGPTDGSHGSPNPQPCASGENSVAIGASAFANKTSAVAIGHNVRAHGPSGVAIGSGAFLADGAGVSRTAIGAGASVMADAQRATAMGAAAAANHAYSSALGYNALTSEAHQMVFGTIAGDNYFAGGGLYPGGGSQGARNWQKTSYRFAGLAVDESQLTGLPTLPGFTDPTYDSMRTMRNNAIAMKRGEIGYTRVLQVNGLGDVRAVEADLGNIGSVSQDSAGSGTLYQRIASLRGSSGGGTSYDDTAVVNRITATETAIGSSDDAADASGSLYARINQNRADIASFQSAGVSSETMAQIDGNTARGMQNAQGVEKNSQGVALSNALSAIPNTLNPGKKLFLGLGVGSFDGKSATAIGVTGKFGASTLLNAGFATGGGESSTRLGIGWEW